MSRTPEQNQKNAKFPFSKFTSYGDNDYELLTKRHLPQNQWEKGLNELNDIVAELSCKSTNNENLELQIDSCTGQPFSGLKDEVPTPMGDIMMSLKTENYETPQINSYTTQTSKEMSSKGNDED